MEFFAENLPLWFAVIVPAAAYLGLATLLARRGRRLPGLGLVWAVAVTAGVLAGFGLVHVLCGWAVDLALPHLIGVTPQFGP